MAGPVAEGASHEAEAEMVDVALDRKTAPALLQSVAVDGAQTADAPASPSRVTSDYTADEVRRCERRPASRL